ncbi:MAG: hypothetical protein BSOLF_0962 [Candidatus Carbobacillus altaicus]|uniref:Uncharacterized protein n=1 Tax=Candidatus Carbonibacillus altaicus TaxID=2163959 RepID=A0A2R6Y0A3_9BACL|nr:MAG: hypothetical protein BSOLF_0962 [Candidatus Carbobacillus altaicus]
MMGEFDLWQSVLREGAFAALFVWLLLYVIRSTSEREQVLLRLIETLSQKYDTLVKDIQEIQAYLKERLK